MESGLQSTDDPHRRYLLLSHLAESLADQRQASRCRTIYPWTRPRSYYVAACFPLLPQSALIDARHTFKGEQVIIAVCYWKVRELHFQASKEMPRKFAAGLVAFVVHKFCSPNSLKKCAIKLVRNQSGALCTKSLIFFFRRLFMMALRLVFARHPPIPLGLRVHTLRAS